MHFEAYLSNLFQIRASMRFGKSTTKSLEDLIYRPEKHDDDESDESEDDEDEDDNDGLFRKVGAKRQKKSQGDASAMSV